MSLKAIYNAIIKITLWMAPGGGLLLVLWELMGGIDGAVSAIDGLQAIIDTASSSIHSTVVSGVYAKANRIFPITESLVMLSTLLSAKVIAMGIRIVKSWIPTIG